MRDQFFIVDGMSLIYRALHQQGPRLISPSGEVTSATYLFCKMFFALVQNAKPSYLAVALDVPRSKVFRRHIYPQYKSSRDRKPPASEESKTQVSRCQEILQKLGVCVIKQEPFEADDVIATLVHECASPEVECVVVTRDKDLHQVVGENCRMFDHQTEVWSSASDVRARWGVPPEGVVDVQTLMGDPRDDVPGVKGIGPKTAQTLFADYGSLQGILDNIDNLKPRVQKALLGADLDLCRSLVLLRRDVPMDLTPNDLAFNGFDWASIRPLFKQLGFDSWLK